MVASHQAPAAPVSGDAAGSEADLETRVDEAPPDLSAAALDLSELRKTLERQGIGGKEAELPFYVG